MQRPFWAFIFAVVASATARADVGFPGIRKVWPTYRVITSEAFPDHVFVIRRSRSVYAKDEKSGNGGWKDVDEAEYAELAPDHPIIISAAQVGTYRGVVLLIAPRATAASYKTAQELVKAVDAHQVADLIRHQFPPRESVPEWYGNEMTVTYRVQHAATGSTWLEIVRTTWNQEYQCCIVGILVPLATILGGVWLTRRWLRGHGRREGPADHEAGAPAD